MSVTTSVVDQQHLMQSVSMAIKDALIDSKFTNEPISFGQAVVTHHFLS